jgi:hypothetical protein
MKMKMKFTIEQMAEVSIAVFSVGIVTGMIIMKIILL